MDKPDFFLASSESYKFENPRACKRIKRISSDTRDDFLLIKIDPPIIGQSYGLGNKDIDTLLIATRHKGASLFPINEWPVYVHIARLLIDLSEVTDKISNKDFESMAWAELYPTEAAAIAKDLI